MKPEGAENKKKNIIITITAVVLALAIAVSVFAIVWFSRDNKFDFLSDDISEYITISEADYKNFPVSFVPEKYSEEKLMREINGLLVKNKSKDALYDGLGTRKIAITLGDVASIYFRGYTVDKDGKQTEFSGSSNYESTPHSLEIGSGSFIPGFEESLIGIVPDDYQKFFKITSGKVSEDMVIYISYYSFAEKENKNASYERLDLSRTDIDSVYGEGFREFILSAEIGKALDSKSFKKGEGSIGYQGLEIKFATECEAEPLTIDVVFPTNYSEKSLRGVAAKFDVFIENAIIYDTPEFNEEFITKTLGVKESELGEYKGNNIVEKYTALLREQVKAEIEEANNDAIITEMWAHYKKKVDCKGLPTDTVELFYNEYYGEAESYYASNSTAFSSLDEAAVKYFGLSSGADWREYIELRAQDVVLEKLIFYYIIREENYLPNADEYDRIYNEVFSDVLNYHLEQNAAELSGLKGDAYNDYVSDLKADILEYYGEDYFKESVYYRYGAEQLVKLAKFDSEVK